MLTHLLNTDKILRFTLTNMPFYCKIELVKEGVFMKGKEMLGAIKKNMDGHIGEKVLLKANSGRRKVVIKEGILEKTYPNIFVIRVEGNDNSSRTVSYSYSDILTQTVQLVFKANDVAIG